MKNSCCNTTENNSKEPGFAFDPILHTSLGIILLTVATDYLWPSLPFVNTFAGASLELLGMMWWGILLGLALIGVMSHIPREYYTKILGRGDSVNGVFRATLAGVFLDLCSHGIVMVGAKLYERGASLAQVMAFLIASPWNSISLTIILVSLIGLTWTLIFVFASALIAVITGCLYLLLVRRGVIKENPNKSELPKENFNLLEDAKSRLSEFKPSRTFFIESAKNSWKEGEMVIRWLFLGVVLAAAIRTFVPTDFFETWFGPTLMGLFATLIATTIIEVCSEGSAPIASDLLNRASAPGNGFAFLMAGVSTDYTEIMVIREFSKSWGIALSLPLLTVPQIIVMGALMNSFTIP